MTSKTAVRRLARQFDLRLVTCADLELRRRRHGRGFAYERADGTRLDAATIERLKRLAVPPAYRHVRYAEDAQAHLQAVGEDDAGRLQYRYHPDWQRVREAIKARRLADLARALPVIVRAVNRFLQRPSLNRAFALAAALRLVSRTAIRAGNEHYAETHGTRGATTLLKSHVAVEGDEVALRFTGKGGKLIEKRVRDPLLASALAKLKALPGRRLFSFRDEDGKVHPVQSRDVNAFLREISGHAISLKDFRTLTASLGVLDQLGRMTPEATERGRRRQIKAAIAPLADELANTLTVCRTSYVHDTVIFAFENGRLASLARARSATTRAALLSRILLDKKCARPSAPDIPTAP